MKCDELKPLVFSLNDLAYVDELAVEKNFENPHDHAVYKATEVDEAIAQLKAVRKVHVEAIASMEAGLHQDGEEIRRLRRALWLARALRARDIQRWWLSVTLAPITERACRVWNNIEIKCLKKAEEYK